MKSLTKAGTRTLSLGLAVLSVVGWSCTKQDEPAMNPHQTEGAIAQARSFYESTAPSLTKTVAEQTIAIKPLPGKMTPLWDRASATVLSDGTTAWVDIPIEAGITYTAVRNGTHHHEAGEECGHNHEAVQAVQKLTIYTASDGTKQSLIATIVPEADCTAKLNDFSSADGLAGFSGFVSWHDLTGKLIRVAKYENGTKTRSVEAAEENNPAVLEIVDNAVLYNSTALPATKTIIDLDPNDPNNPSNIKCYFCGDKDCKRKNIAYDHCNMCGKYDPKDRPSDSKCICPRCNICGKYKKKVDDDQPDREICQCKNPVATPRKCDVCGKLVCAHPKPDDSGGVPIMQLTVHEGILTDILGYLFTTEEFLLLKGGSHTVDWNYQNAGDEYLHGMYVYRDGTSQQTAQTQMRNYFISKMRGFVQTGDLGTFGEGIHPVLDTYMELQPRIDMLNYYSYEFKHNTIQGQFVAPYTINSYPCRQAVQFIWSSLYKMETTVTDAQIGAVFDKWVGTTGGDLLL